MAVQRPLYLLATALVLAGCAHAPVVETLTPYQGDPIDGLNRVIFDGDHFIVGGSDAISRDEVQKVAFSMAQAAGGAGAETSTGEGLTPEAEGLLERGQALAAKYPGVGGITLMDDGDFVYHADGTSLYRYHFAGLVLKEEKKSWAQLSHGFTEGRSRVRILFARSFSKKGAVSNLDASSVQIGSPSEELQFFNPNRKVLSGTIPGVEVGSVVEYAYEFEQYNPEDPRLFFPGYFFQGTEPVALSRVKVVVPKGVTFHYVARHFPDGLPEKPVITERGGEVAYTWVLEDVPPLVPEPSMPPERDVLPMMDGSIFASFDDAFGLQAGLQRPRMALTPEIDAKVKEITGGAETVDGQVARIYHWVQENTRYISIKGSLGSGWSGHTAQQTFENRYGDCTDKAVLFATMCEAIGVTAYPIILMTNDQGVGVTEIPTLDANHCISEVEFADGRRLYLDSTAQNFRYPYFRPDDHGAFAINAIRGDIQRIPVPPPEDNARFSHLDIELKPTGDVLVKTRNSYTGSYEAGVRGYWKRVREDEQHRRMSEYVNSISPGAVLEDFTLSDLTDLETPLTMTLDYVLHHHAIRAKDLLYMRVPTLERDYPEVALEARRFPIQYMTTQQKMLEADIALPKGYAVKWTPEPLEITTPYLEYRGEYRLEKGALRLRERFRRLKRIVPVEDYPAYRDALRAIAAFSKKEIFFRQED